MSCLGKSSVAPSGEVEAGVPVEAGWLEPPEHAAREKSVAAAIRETKSRLQVFFMIVPPLIFPRQPIGAAINGSARAY